jgi:signal peptidase I
MTDQNPPAPSTAHDPSGRVPSIDTAGTTPPAPSLTTTPAANTQKSRSLVREVIETLLLALLIFVLVRAVVLNFRVEGHSMDTSLQNNEMLLVNRNAYISIDQDKWFGWIPFVDTDDGDIWYPFGTPERGDIVVINPPDEASNPDKPYIKRVIGLPGDTIEIRDEGVYIDGIRIDEPYIDEGNVSLCRSASQYCGPIEIPEGYVYVMGDNRMNSEDSRFFGLVPIDNIIGKAWITYWPVGEVGIVPHYDYPELDETGS